MTRPPDDRDMDQLVRSWLREDEGHPADRNRQIGRIMGRSDETRQRRGPWRFLPFWHHGTATDQDADDLVPARREGVVSMAVRREGVPPMAMAVVAVLALVVASVALALLSNQESTLGPAANPTPMPSASPTPLPVVAADEDLFERMGVGTWKGLDTDVVEALAIYDDDAVHTSLWLDESERFVGNAVIYRRMLDSARVDSTDELRIRLPDHRLGARRYLSHAPALSGTSCVVWIENEQITRHDCILPLSFEDTPVGQASGDLVLADMRPPSAADIEARAKLSSELTEALADDDALRLSEVIAPDVVHHVQSDNQAYKVIGFSDWMTVMSSSPVETMAIVDLPAPEGELRWANFSSVGNGTLCVFWAREGQISRQDCVVPGYTAPWVGYLSDDAQSSPGP